MKNLTLFILFTLHLSLFTLHLSSQPCLPEGITFTTQAEIDNFQTNYPNCTEIEGDVAIYGDDITNLDGLSNVITIGGTLQIGNNIQWSGANPVLISLEGLGNLCAVGGDLEILGNDILVDLSGLESLTSIGGSLVIGDWWNTWPCANLSLLSLDGLNNLSSVGDRIRIFGGIVEDISALSNLTSINGNVNMRYVPSLQSLDGLNNISSIGGYLILFGLGMTNLSDLDNLSYIAGGFTLTSNDSLISLSGLATLDSIGGTLHISCNSILENLSGLENLTFIGGSLYVSFNDTLTSLTGLENIDLTSIDNLEIRNNKLLSNCEVQSICDYLASPNGTITIYGNAPGCNSPGEIANACGFPMPCLPFGNYYITSQAEVDSFQSYYPGCTDLTGDVTTVGYPPGNTPINNLNGLDIISSVEGSLWIQYNDSLTSLAGLDSLISIGGDLWIIENVALTGLAGLDFLTSIGGNLLIQENVALTSVSGLDSVTSIGGALSIGNNDVLTSLTGLDNIDAGTISDLYIYENNLLSTCDVQSVCDYLTDPNGDIYIYNNDLGCNNVGQVFIHCFSGFVEHNKLENEFSTFPNPFTKSATLEIVLQEPGTVEIKIYGQMGQLLKTIVRECRIAGKQKIALETRNLPAGVYFCVLKTNEGIQTTKIIKL